MYAIIEAGGKQHRVSPGEMLRVERVALDEGQPVEFDKVLLVSDDAGLRIGRPLVEGAKVLGKVVSQERDRKIIVFKKKRTKQYRRTKGHRQYLTAVRIEKIEG